MSPLHDACRDGDTERVRQLLDEGAPVDEKNEGGMTVGGFTIGGFTALMVASLPRRSTRERGAEVVQLLLDKGAAVDEKDNVGGSTALMLASQFGRTEVVQLLLDKGAAVDVKDKGGHTALPAFVTFDEDQLGRMAAAQVQRQLLKVKGQEPDSLLAKLDAKAGKEWEEHHSAKLDATARAVLQLVRLAGFARKRALKLRSSDPHSADDHQALFGRLQLAIAACVLNDGSGKARDENLQEWQEKDAHKLLRSSDGGKALKHAVQIEAKELLAQPVVQGYIEEAWRGPLDLSRTGWLWGPTIVGSLLIVMLQLLIFLPLVALVPPLDSWLAGKLDQF